MSVRSHSDLLHSAHRLKLPFPTSMRDLLAILSLHDPNHDFDGFLGRFAGESVTDAQIERLFPGRPSQATAHGGAPANAQAMLAARLRSREFQSVALQAIVTAFPEKRRDVFIHIPKCAGTDLTLKLGPSRLTIPGFIEAEAWVETDDFLASLAEITRHAPFFDSFFICGHIRLSRYLEQCGARPQDRIFTIIRHPIDMMISQANFSISRLRQDPEAKSPDTQSIRKQLGLTVATDALSPGDLREAAVQALLDPRISLPNLMCRYLGSSDRVSAADALRNVVEHDIEITDTKRYTRWLRERWRIEETSRHNRSWPILHRAEMMRLFGDQLRERTAEDMKFFDAVTSALNSAESASIFGRDIAKYACLHLVTLPSAAAGEVEGEASAIVFNDVTVSAAQAGLLSQHVTGLRPVVAGATTFGRDGNAYSSQREGWSKPEQRFTWAIDGESVLVLPRPTVPADYALQIRLTPYIAKPDIAAQTLIVKINGRDVGKAAIIKPSLAQFEVPWRVLESDEQTHISFTFPDAARPSETASSKAQDKRRLGCAFAWLRLIAYVRPPETGPESVAADPEKPVVPVLESAGAIDAAR